MTTNPSTWRIEGNELVEQPTIMKPICITYRMRRTLPAIYSRKKLKAMTEAEIIEGNKLIAEFMGAKLSERNGELAVWLSEDAAFPEYFRVTIHNKYHLSWDALMPVVEKINTISIHNYGEMGVYIKPFTCYIGSDETDPVIVTTSGNYPKLIEMVWSAVVTFIRWYNQNSKA